MEHDIFDSLEDLGYEGELLDPAVFSSAIESGVASTEFTKCVAWLTTELAQYYNISERVNTAQAEDAESFLLELSGFLREFGCPHKRFMEGEMDQRLSERRDRVQLLDFLLTEVQAARITAVNMPEIGESLTNLQIVPDGSNQMDAGKTMKRMMIALDIPKPPSDITTTFLFTKIESVINSRISETLMEPRCIGVPLLRSALTEDQWASVEFIGQALKQDYEFRRKMILQRLDLTINSLGWSDRLKHRADELSAAFNSCRRKMFAHVETDTAHLLAAREDLLTIEKASAESSKAKTRCGIKRILIGAVPDRGGRAYELERPSPDMPSFRQRQQPGPQREGGGKQDWSKGGQKQGRRGRGGDGKAFWEGEPKPPKRGCYK